MTDGTRSAPKALERARRQLLKQGDIEGLEYLLKLTERVETPPDLAYAIRQNLRFLRRKAQARSGDASIPAPDPPLSSASSRPTPAHGKSFLFGNPRRPRSLALAWIASIALFPVAWFGLLILWALGGGSYTDQETQHAERVIVVIAAIPSAIGMVAALLDWIDARRSYPPSERVALRSGEGAWSATAALVVLGSAVALGVYLWTSLV